MSRGNSRFGRRFLVATAAGLSMILVPDALAQSMRGHRSGGNIARYRDRDIDQRTDDQDDVGEEVSEVIEWLSHELRRHNSWRRLRPLTDADFYPRHEEKESLGKLLFHDKILSGNRNISCATCHHALTDTGDGLSLSIGEGANGLGVARNTGLGDDAVPERVPRNAPHVFNLGAIQFSRLFHDGRVEIDPYAPSGFLSPAGADLPAGLDNPLAVQAMFPVTSGTEMAGQSGENDVADAAGDGNLPLVWDLLALRLQGIPEYVSLFIDAFDDVSSAADITYAHAANAIAAYEAAAFRADNSPFDRYLRGNFRALSTDERRGMHLFYGKAGCGDCHTGVLQTDHGFHAIGIPQIGPGKGDNLPGYKDGHDDFGRERVTGDIDDRFRFRTPSLRNVALTGPWGHDGAYNTLEAVVRHHLKPIASASNYDTSQAVLPSRSDLDAEDFVCHNDPARRKQIMQVLDIQPRNLSAREFRQLMDFLHALTDRESLDLRREVPARVPSGLPVWD